MVVTSVLEDLVWIRSRRPILATKKTKDAGSDPRVTSMLRNQTSKHNALEMAGAGFMEQSELSTCSNEDSIPA